MHKHTSEGSFIRRVATPCTEFPRRALWLIAEGSQTERVGSECLHGISIGAIHQFLHSWHNVGFLCFCVVWARPGANAAPFFPKDCPVRREVAVDMLAMVREGGAACAGEAAFATAKIATAFRSELEIVAATGRCPPMLYDFTRTCRACGLRIRSILRESMASSRNRRKWPLT